MTRPIRRGRPPMWTVAALAIAATAAAAPVDDTYPVKLGRAVRVGQTFAVTCKADLEQKVKVVAGGRTGQDTDEKVVAELDGTVTILAVNRLGQPTQFTVAVDKLTGNGVAVFPPGTVVTADHTAAVETMTVDGKPVDDAKATVLAATINVQPADRTTSDDDMLGTAKPQPVGGTWAGDPAKFAEAFAADHLPVSASHLSVTSTLTAVKPVDGVRSQVVTTTVKADRFDPGDVNGLTVTGGSLDGTITVTLPVDQPVPAVVADEHLKVTLKAAGTRGVDKVEADLVVERTVHRTMVLKK